MSHRKRKIASKKQNLEHKCILQDSCKTVKRWQRSILLVRGDHCVGDCVWNCSVIHSAFHVPVRIPFLFGF